MYVPCGYCGKYNPANEEHCLWCDEFLYSEDSFEVSKRCFAKKDMPRLAKAYKNPDISHDIRDMKFAGCSGRKWAKVRSSLKKASNKKARA
jgi:hypothetical protein